MLDGYLNYYYRRLVENWLAEVRLLLLVVALPKP
jgi:hypothetical protein